MLLSGAVAASERLPGSAEDRRLLFGGSADTESIRRSVGYGVESVEHFACCARNVAALLSPTIKTLLEAPPAALPMVFDGSGVPAGILSRKFDLVTQLQSGYLVLQDVLEFGGSHLSRAPSIESPIMLLVDRLQQLQEKVITYSGEHHIGEFVELKHHAAEVLLALDDLLHTAEDPVVAEAARTSDDRRRLLFKFGGCGRSDIGRRRAVPASVLRGGDVQHLREQQLLNLSHNLSVAEGVWCVLETAMQTAGDGNTEEPVKSVQEFGQLARVGAEVLRDVLTYSDAALVHHPDIHGVLRSLALSFSSIGGACQYVDRSETATPEVATFLQTLVRTSNISQLLRAARLRQQNFRLMEDRIKR